MRSRMAASASRSGSALEMPTRSKPASKAAALTSCVRLTSQVWRICPPDVMPALLQRAFWYALGYAMGVATVRASPPSGLAPAPAGAAAAPLDLPALLYGANPLPRLVAVEPSGDGGVVLYRR